jgi:hypothetical protein
VAVECTYQMVHVAVADRTNVLDPLSLKQLYAMTVIRLVFITGRLTIAFRLCECHQVWSLQVWSLRSCSRVCTRSPSRSLRLMFFFTFVALEYWAGL